MAFEFNLNDVSLAANTAVDLSDLFGDAFGNSISTDDGAAITWYQLWDKSGAGYFEGPNGNSSENGGGYYGVEFGQDGWVAADQETTRGGETFAGFDQQTYVAGPTNTTDTIWIRAYDENGVASEWQSIDITTDREIELTAGTDQLSGSGSDDRFTALLSQNEFAGGVSNTLASADWVDGGAGNDSLFAELVPEFFGAAGTMQIDVQPTLSGIETIATVFDKIRARKTPHALAKTAPAAFFREGRRPHPLLRHPLSAPLRLESPNQMVYTPYP